MFYNEAENKYIQEGTSFELNGIQYPPQWLNSSTPEEKQAIGLQEVIAQNQPFNPVYYWTGEVLDGPTLTYTGTPKDLTEVKTNAIAQVNQTAYTLLFPTDWMVVKAFETSTKVPTSWNTWRAEIRTQATGYVSQVEAANDVDAVATIMQSLSWAKDPDTVAAEALSAVQ